MKIIEYMIVSADRTGALGKMVQNRIKEGWQPFGNMIHVLTSMGYSHPTSTFKQPMVKYEEVL